MHSSTPASRAKFQSPIFLWLLGCATLLSGCATYQTPGAGISIGNLSKADADIAELIKREPASPFPARVAIARLQAPGYYSQTNSCFGKGSYCVVTTRDVESESDVEHIAKLPMVAAVAPMNSVLLPTSVNTVKDLRIAAATLKTDLLLVYSFDTRFHVESTEIGPLALISLGFLPNKKAYVSTTASAALFDVRTGFVYGTVEATQTQHQAASVWSETATIDNARVSTEAQSFKKMLGEFDKLWKGVVETAVTVPAKVDDRSAKTF